VTAVPILRTSERRAFKRCHRRWWWGYREGYKPIGAERTPLWFGTIAHISLAEWYIPGRKRGVHPAETFKLHAAEAMRTVKVVTETDEETVTSWEEAATLGVTLLEEYVNHWGKDESWDFIQAEQTFSLGIPWPVDDRQKAYVVDSDSGLLVEYKGTYDGVYRDLVDGRIKLLETKTARSIQLGHLTIDDQAGSYWAVASRTLQDLGKIGPKESIAGINYNFLRKALPDTRPRDPEGYACNKPVKKDYGLALGLITADSTPAQCKSLPTIEKMEEISKSRGITVLGERSKVQPGPLFHRELIHRTSAERRSQLLAIQDEAVHMQALRDGTLPITRNPTYDCHRDCDYFAPCELKERGGDANALLKIAYRREDPYKDHRKSTDE
jgi:hypothetical protein